MNLRLSATLCPVCNEAIEPGEAVVTCPGCKTSYHFDCWADVGVCSTQACQDAANPLASLQSHLRGSKEKPFVPSGDKNTDGEPGWLPRQDLTTTLELFLQYSAGLLLLYSAFMLRGPNAPWYRPHMAILGICFAALRYGTDCTYFIDDKNRNIIYSRDFFGFTSKYVVCSFDDVFCIALDGYSRRSGSGSSSFKGRFFVYALVLITKSGKKIKMSDAGITSDYTYKRGAAERLASVLGVKAIPGEEDQHLVIEYDHRTQLPLVKYTSGMVFSLKTCLPFILVILGFIIFGLYILGYFGGR